MDETGKLLSVAEVCDYLRLSRTTVYQARKEGNFAPEIRLGTKHVVFAEKDLLAWLKSRQSGGEQMAA